MKIITNLTLMIFLSFAGGLYGAEFLHLRPPANQLTVETHNNHNPFDQNQLDAVVAETLKVEKDDPDASLAALEQIHWGTLIPPHEDFSGLVIMDNRIVRPGEPVVLGGVSFVLLEIHSNSIVFGPSEGEDSTEGILLSWNLDKAAQSPGWKGGTR